MAIKNIADFISELRKLPKNKNKEIYFRGHSDINYPLVPSIYRTPKAIANEHIMFKEFILRTPHDFINEKSALEKLVKMQHYSLPTRLLDLTTNPLVALYFACSGSNKKEGNVIAFSIPNNDIKYFDSDTVSIIANIAKRPASFAFSHPTTEIESKEFNRTDQIAYLLHEIKEEKSYFQDIIKPTDLERVVAVKVKQNNNRIIKQAGAFLLFGINRTKNAPATLPASWIMNLRIKNIDFNIDANSKNNILEELNLLGINESSLFPELDNQAKYLRKYFG